MSTFLDKTISLRQVLKWTIRLFLLAIPMYGAAVFVNAWNLKMGGISLNRSPFKAQIPEKCIPYAGRSYGYNNGFLDQFLLRGRVRRLPVENATSNSPSTYLDCFGYSLIAGLHSITPGDADFIEQWVDVNGDPVVTVRVEYHQPYSREWASQK